MRMASMRFLGDHVCCVQFRWDSSVAFRSREASGLVHPHPPTPHPHPRLNCVIFIMFNLKSPSSRWLIGSLAEPLCKINPFPQQSKKCFTGDAVEDFDFTARNCVV